jgi:hypothetical protein
LKRSDRINTQIIFQANEALDYVTNRKIFWAQQQTPEKLCRKIDTTATTKVKLIAIGTFIKDSIPKKSIKSKQNIPKNI